MAKIRCTFYLDRIYQVAPYESLIKEMVTKLRKYSNEYDAIAFSGTSGAAVAYPASIRLKKPLICVRKEKAHSSYRVEGAYGVSRYIIVDDLIDSGTTMLRITRGINSAYRKFDEAKPTCVRIFLYNDCDKRKKQWNDIPITHV